MTLDELRAAHPELGLAVYAYEPGGVVTLEIHDGGHVYPFGGTTLQEAIEKAFPVSCVPLSADPKGVVAAEPETVSVPTQGRLESGTHEPSSVFD